MLADEGYDEAYGARPLRRTIQRKLEDTLSEALLRGDIHLGDHVRAQLSAENGIDLLTLPALALNDGEPVRTEEVCAER